MRVDVPVLVGQRDLVAPVERLAGLEAREQHRDGVGAHPRALELAQRGAQHLAGARRVVADEHARRAAQRAPLAQRPAGAPRADRDVREALGAQRGADERRQVAARRAQAEDGESLGAIGAARGEAARQRDAVGRVLVEAVKAGGQARDAAADRLGPAGERAEQGARIGARRTAGERAGGQRLGERAGLSRESGDGALPRTHRAQRVPRAARRPQRDGARTAHHPGGAAEPDDVAVAPVLEQLPDRGGEQEGVERVVAAVECGGKPVEVSKQVDRRVRHRGGTVVDMKRWRGWQAAPRARAFAPRRS